MKSQPFFSILVPTYNQCQYLGEALDSLINQTDGDWEAIIVNDGSTDDTPAVLEKYARQDSRFQVIHKQNGGTGSALNLALSKANGSWICWLSSDDVFEINKLKLHRQWIHKYPDHQFFFSNFRQLIGTTGEITDCLCEDNLEIELQSIELFKRNFIAGNSICIAKDAWLSVGFFNEELRYAQDYEMWFRLIIKYPAVFIPEPTYQQRVYPNQESARFWDFCLYDSAKASIGIINQYSIKELCPLLDFNNQDMLRKVVISLLDITFDANALVYQLGYHPVLILRAKSFINLVADPELSQVFSDRLNECILNHPHTLGFWGAISQGLDRSNRFNLNESLSVSLIHISQAHYLWLTYTLTNQQLASQNSSIHQSISTYLQRFCRFDTNQMERSIDNYRNLLSLVLRSPSIDNQQIYNKAIAKLDLSFLKYPFLYKLMALEKANIPLQSVSQTAFSTYGKYGGWLATLLFYLLRSLRSLQQGTLIYRFGKYIGRIKYANALKAKAEK
ncbi:MAG: glycosyltransferase family A protein [Pseudanabaenaceae cyanobacterium bins.39]|nr:glycosyltransferase family A protein [Pseudanabaenaceae cyanobacterium bins.39]